MFVEEGGTIPVQSLLVQLRSRQGRPLITSHRGHFGGNIVQNTIHAFENAIAHGADIIELDVVPSADGVLYCFHDGSEPQVFGSSFDIRSMNAIEIDALQVRNCIQKECGYPLSRFDRVLNMLAHRTVINVDRSWPYLTQVLEQIRHFTLREKILLKTPVKEDWLAMVADMAPDVPYMPIVKSINDFVCASTYGVQMSAVELIFPSHDHELVQPDFLSELRTRGVLPCVNAIDLGEQFQLSGGLTDTGAITSDPEAHWGKLADMGFEIIQTDWPLLLKTFLEERTA